MADEDKKLDPKADAKAKPDSKTAEDADAGLVKMRKGDQVLYVHPTCVEDHKEVNWEAC